MSDQGKILIVENVEDWRVRVKEILEKGGFQVDVASSFEEAIAKLKSSFYHLIVIDIRLDVYNVDEMNREGMTILHQLEQLGLGDALEKIVLSAFGTLDDMREAFKDFNVADFIYKGKFTRSEFMPIVLKVFKNKVLANFDLKIILEDGLTYEELATNITLQGSRLPNTDPRIPRVVDELVDLFRKLFHNAHSIVVHRMTRGHGPAAVVRVVPFFAQGHGENVVVKFGSHEDIDRENTNYEKYVRGKIGFRTTNVLTVRRTMLLGGIVYSLVGIELERTEDFADFYAQHAIDEITELLNNLFNETCNIWYTDTGNIQYVQLTERYLGSLLLNQERMEKAIKDNFPYYLGQNTLTFRDLPGVVVPNPIYLAKDRVFTASTYLCITHGDLNANNILIDPHKHTWLIDFYRTGEGHILRDCTELETVVKFMLLTGTKLQERYTLERALVSIDRFSEIRNIHYEAPDVEYGKAFTVIQKIREIARGLVHPNDSFREYYIGLLYHSLKFQQFYSQPKVNRLHALIAAGLICEKLDLHMI